MHYYKRNIGDYAKKAGRLCMLEHGAYTILIDACYDRERFPTRDEAIEWTWARTVDEITAVEFVLSRFFILTDGVYVQKRIADEISAYNESRSINKKIATNRELERRKRTRRDDEPCTNRERTVNEAPPNQEPRTLNQEPITNIKPKAPALPLPDWLNVETWKDYLETRKVLKSPMTDRAKLLAISKLTDLMKSGHDPNLVLNQSIYNGWKGLFPIKLDLVNGKGQTRHEQLADKLADLTGSKRRNESSDPGVIHGTAERLD